MGPATFQTKIGVFGIDVFRCKEIKTKLDFSMFFKMFSRDIYIQGMFRMLD
jgi:hypothetical protein